MIKAERITTAQTSDARNSDCYGTAFFLVGKIRKEKILKYAEIEKILDECPEVGKPEVGSLVLLWNGEEGHLSVVSCLDPLLVTGREGIGGVFRENIPLYEVLLEYGGLDISVQYLQP